MYIYVHLWKYFSEFFPEWEIFHTEVVGEVKTHTMFKNFF